MKRSLCAFIIASFAITTGYCFAEDIWTINTVTYRQSGQPSVTVDMNNNPVMAFTSMPLPYAYSTLYTAAQTNTGYLVEQVDSVSDAAWPKIAFTSNNELAMVFFRGSNYLWYASKSDWFDWTFSQISTSRLSSYPIDMALTDNASPHIVYNSRSVGILHTFFDIQTQQWVAERLAGFDNTYGNPIMDISSDNKIIVCGASISNKILVAVENGDLWDYKPVIIPGTKILGIDCSFTADNMPAIAYLTNQGLYYAVYINNVIGWVQTFAISAQITSPPFGISLKHSSTGIPGIAYTNDGKLMYATNIAGGWTITEIDTLSSIPYSSFDLIFDKNDKPLIAYNGIDECLGMNVIKLAGIGLEPFNVADLNNDKAINFKDFAMMAENWMTILPQPDSSAGDFNQDAKVDALDLRWISCNWLY